MTTIQENIIYTIKDFKDKKLLDFGCGDASSTIQTLFNNTKQSIGYDIIPQKQWQQWSIKDMPVDFTWNRLIITSIWYNVLENKPYDIIILNDVIDHLIEDTISECLNKLKNILRNDGTIYVRCHPFSSRDGGHIEDYDHIILNNEEIEQKYNRSLPFSKRICKTEDYETFFNKSQYKIISKSFIKEPVNINHIKLEEFKQQNNLKEDDLEIRYVDYILKNK